MSIPEEERLIFDWSANGERTAHWPKTVMLYDESLRDGLQSPSVIDPPIEKKVEILHLMEALGIDFLDAGLPGAGSRQREAVTRLCREIASQRMRIRATCAARTVAADIQPIAGIVQLTGVPIEAMVFIGSSPIRQYAEEWTRDFIVRQSREAIEFAIREGLDVTYVTEDTTRSKPDDLRVLLNEAIDAGAKRVCLCDTCGATTPDGAYNLVRWVRELIGNKIGIDWHGHRDRGFDLANSFAAIEAGATRIHGTALGIGERVGNTPMEQLLLNLRLLGIRHDDLSRLPEYVSAVATAAGVPVSANAPIVGHDAFRTATGVHAAAVIKARKRGQDLLANLVYSGVPAHWIGRRQEIEIGPMSGNSNVSYWLAERGFPVLPEIVAAIFAEAKRSDRVLNEVEIMRLVERFDVVTT
ncbi:MAG TPA: LeuA family protein [Thermoanaerobaculia bacterium]|nr:LeuA family protein [Thermoanaerobaculia bacterium]